MAGPRVFNISPAGGAFNSPLSQTGDIAPNRHSAEALRGPMSQTVLIVDDDPVQRRLLEAMVQRFGHQALVAEGGDQGLMAEALDHGFEQAALNRIVVDDEHGL